MSAVSAPAEWTQPAPGSFISILGPHCPSKGQKKLLENLYPQEETPRLVSVSPNHTFFLGGGTLLIISYEVITFWISRNNLWHLPFLHYHLKTITRPKRKQSFHLKIFGECVWESILVLLGHWVIKKKTLKNSFESELKHTAVGRSVWRQRKTRRYYFKQLSVWALALYKIMTVLVHKTVLKPTGFSCHSFSGLCKRSPDHPHWTSMQCLLTSGFEGNQQGPLHLLSPP